jgi:hypothetical protein
MALRVTSGHESRSFSEENVIAERSEGSAFSPFLCDFQRSRGLQAPEMEANNPSL